MKKKLILKLIETNDTPKVGDLVIDNVSGGDVIFITSQEHSYDIGEYVKVVKPYGISDEEIKESDWYTNGKHIFKCSTLGEVNSERYDYLKKVEILPEQFNYQDIVDLGLKDNDEFEVASEYGMDTLGSMSKLRFKTIQGKVSISKPSQVLYTEEELSHYWYHLGAADGIACSLSGSKPPFEERYKEFNENKKK